SGTTTLTNQGGAMFSGPVTSAVYGGDVMAVGDFNGDGNVDVAAWNSGNQDVFGFAYGDGSGRFPSAGTVKTPRFCGAAPAGDFNGDGRDDLAVVYINKPMVHVYLAQQGGFMPPVTYASDAGADAVAAADLNGDGKIDLAINTGRPAIDVFV